jgi:spermidine/putrescine transport system ATP-binding protein
MIEIQHVAKRFGSFTAVEDLTLSIEAGEFLTLLGPSGCGKTTLLRMISGFESPDRGTILLDGKDVTPLPPYRRDVNQVFQSYALFPHLSVRGNIAFGLRMRRMPAKQIDEKVAAAIEMVSLNGMEHRMPDQLSGGQRQRVALARALVCEPKVLLLDEPLAALDAKLRRSMQVELKRLRARLGITFVFVTHDQEEAMTMSDRIAVMNRGRIEQLGAPTEIYQHPATPFVATFLGQTNLLPVTVLSSDPQTIRVRLSDGTEMNCNPPRSIESGATLSIRPEHVLLTREPSQQENEFRVELHDRLFKGAFEQLLVRTAAGLELTVVQPAGALGDVRAGDLLSCRLQRDKLIWLDAALS